MNIVELLLLTVIATVIANVFILPLILLWDIIALVIYLAAPKENADKRKNARDGFIVSSTALIINAALLALTYGLTMLFEHL